mgnify:CR=1 FL=1
MKVLSDNIKLRTGQVLHVQNPRTLKSIICAQLHTRLVKPTRRVFKARPKAVKKVHTVPRLQDAPVITEEYPEYNDAAVMAELRELITN